MEARLSPKTGYPPYIKITDGDNTGLYFVIWTKKDALNLAHKLMSLAHELQREINK